MSHRPAFVWLLWACAAPLGAATYDLSPGNDVIGEDGWLTARAPDTLIDYARRYSLGYEELKLANPDVDPWLPGAGTLVRLPARFILPSGPRRGIVINLAELRLYYFPAGGRTVMTYPVSIGREGRHTPLMKTRVTAKLIHPTWRPTARMRAEAAAAGDVLPETVPPGPDNPMGPLALKLGRPGYLIHGTNRPYGIGIEVSSGCLRLMPEDIEELFAAVPQGTPVRVVHEPWKAGWDGEALYFEQHAEPRAARRVPDALARAVVEAARRKPGFTIDWQALADVLSHTEGLPRLVPRPATAAGGGQRTESRLCGIPGTARAHACRARTE